VADAARHAKWNSNWSNELLTGRSWAEWTVAWSVGWSIASVVGKVLWAEQLGRSQERGRLHEKSIVSKDVTGVIAE
jgi:hypothetical protein